eukprot:7503925-Alexandrium_andersonii.AAC.1
MTTKARTLVRAWACVWAWARAWVAAAAAGGGSHAACAKARTLDVGMDVVMSRGVGTSTAAPYSSTDCAATAGAGTAR